MVAGNSVDKCPRLQKDESVVSEIWAATANRIACSILMPSAPPSRSTSSWLRTLGVACHQPLSRFRFSISRPRVRSTAPCAKQSPNSRQPGCHCCRSQEISSQLRRFQSPIELQSSFAWSVRQELRLISTSKCAATESERPSKS